MRQEPKTPTHSLECAQSLSDFRGIRLLAFCVAAAEFIYLASGIQDFLFARVERMTLRTHFDMHGVIFIRRLRLKGVAATAGYSDFFIVWMDIWLHGVVSERGNGHSAVKTESGSY